jgi:hypothetical protein
MNNRELLERSLTELQGQLERHQRVLHSAFQGVAAESPGCCLEDCRHRQRLCAVLLDAVRVLEDTRRAFKSKQLEALRKDFLRILKEELQYPV